LLNIKENKLNIFKKPTPLQIAQRELTEAEHGKLSAQSAAEYALSMVRYNEQRIARLVIFIKAQDV
jgi:hypothetical protein